MSHQTQVAPAYNKLSYMDMHFDDPKATTNAFFASIGPTTTTTVKKNSFRSINFLSIPKTSFENDTRKNRCMTEARDVNALALERKLKRKSFFENVCGKRAAKIESEPVKQTACAVTAKVSSKAPKAVEMSISLTQSLEDSILSTSNEAAFGCTSTDDSDSLSIERMIANKMACGNKKPFEISIKKTKLSRNTNSKLQFVPLTLGVKAETVCKDAQLINKIEFPKNEYGSDILGLKNEISEWDGKWADLDEITIKQVLARN